MSHHASQLRAVAIVICLGAFACSSDDAASPTTGAGSTSSGQGGAGGSSGPTTGTGGSSGSTTSSGSTSSTSAGTAGTAGASSGSAGAAGASVDAGGGSGGSGGSSNLDASSKEGGGPADAGSREGGSPDGNASDASTQFSLTTSAFMPGGTFPRANTCANGDNSPDLSWTAGPATTKGYAIVLWDTTNMYRHWVIWDIPPDTTSLPMALAKTATLTTPAGAKQVSFRNSGYAGPCPPGGGVDVYEFDLYAVDALPLPGASSTPAGNENTVVAAQNAVIAHQVAKTTLRGQGSAN